MIAWWAATLTHALLTAHWLKRGGTAENRDEFWFQTTVVAIGSLSTVLHLLASTVGLSFWRVLAVLAIGHAIAAWRSRSNLGRAIRTETEPGITRGLEIAATVTLAAIVLQWILIAGRTAEVSGSDAAHYHLPNAINLALGASPFDLPPTGHLYPMGSSTLAAWFLLPARTTLLSDLVMVLPFLLLLSASGWLFRQVTSASGLAWSTWMMLALFATPLFRAASLMSADLLFAAATAAVIASTLTPLIRQRLTRTDVWLIALSLGLLLGAKVTGAVAATLFGIPALVTLIVLKLRGRWTTGVPGVVWPAALGAVIGAGGIWLIRNWWVWGSPIAPNGLTILGIQIFAGSAYADTRTYLSVFGDMTEKADYPLWARTSHFIETWLSAWYLPALALMALIPLDAAVRRGRSLALAVMLTVLASGAVIAWLLVGAPWTSLEWTGGFSLRYALPWLALLPAMAWIALFPASLPWFRRPSVAALAGIVSIAGALVLLSQHREPAFPPMPSLGAWVTAIALVAGFGVLHFARGIRVAAIALSVAAASVLLGQWMSATNLAAQDARAAAIANGPRTNGERIFDTAIAFEAKEGRSCDAEGRRFFITNRFDEAGALQGPRLTNKVFYAARDVRVTARVRPPMGPCDYVLTEHAIMQTNKGAALHNALNPTGTLVEIGLIGDVALLVHR